MVTRHVDTSTRNGFPPPRTRVIPRSAASSPRRDLLPELKVLQVVKEMGVCRAPTERVADRVVRFVVGVMKKHPKATVLEQETPDGLGFALWEEGRIIGVVTVDVAAGVVTDVRMMMNPYKLTVWN